MVEIKWVQCPVYFASGFCISYILGSCSSSTLDDCSTFPIIIFCPASQAFLCPSWHASIVQFPLVWTFDRVSFWIYLHFLFKWRFWRETWLLEWLLFFRQFNAIGPLFVQYALLPYVLSTAFSTHPKTLTWDKKPFQSRRVPLSTFLTLWDFPLFFGTLRLFKFLIFSNRFFVPKDPLINCLIFCNRMEVQKIAKAPLLYVLALCDLPKTSKTFKKNRKLFSTFFNFVRALVVSSCRKSGFRVL